jgi:ferredoxin-NADP reductase
MGWFTCVLFFKALFEFSFGRRLTCSLYLQDVSIFLDSHPGGRDSMVRFVGMDATSAFNGLTRAGSLGSLDLSEKKKIPPTLSSGVTSSWFKNIFSGLETTTISNSHMVPSMSRRGSLPRRSQLHVHSRLARLKLNALAIGIIKEYDNKDANLLSVEEGDLIPLWFPVSNEKALSEIQFRSFPLHSKTMLSGPQPNSENFNSGECKVYLFKFAFPSEKDEVWFKPGDSIEIQLTTIEGKTVCRPYTPLTCQAVGYFSLIIKIVPNGKLTSLLDDLEVGDEVCIRGPSHCPKSLLKLSVNRKTTTFKGDTEYEPSKPSGEEFPLPVDLIDQPLDIKIDSVCKGCYENIGLVSAGTGLTPMLLILDYYLRFCPRDVTTGKMLSKITLLHQVSSLNELVYTSELHALLERAAGMLEIHYFIHSSKKSVVREDVRGFSSIFWEPIGLDTLKLYMPSPWRVEQVARTAPPVVPTFPTSGKLLHLSFLKPSVSMEISSSMTPIRPKQQVSFDANSTRDLARARPAEIHRSDGSRLRLHRNHEDPGGSQLSLSNNISTTPVNGQLQGSLIVESGKSLSRMESFELKHVTMNSFIAVCGPTGFTGNIIGHLQALGYTGTQVVVL